MKIQRVFLLILIVMFLSVLGGMVDAQQEKPCNIDTFGESDALDVAQQWASLVSQADTVGLERLLNDKYIHIHSTALVESKSQFIEAF
ncbi:MAG: hypothetical protein WCO89_07350, partial [Syntrophus sp. (in: bacteria)]